MSDAIITNKTNMADFWSCSFKIKIQDAVRDGHDNGESSESNTDSSWGHSQNAVSCFELHPMLVSLSLGDSLVYMSTIAFMSPG